MISEVHKFWGGVAIAITAIAAVTVMLIMRVPVEEIGTGFLAIGTLVTLFLVSEVQKVKQNTNGTIAELQSQVKDLTDRFIAYASKSPPLGGK